MRIPGPFPRCFRPAALVLAWIGLGLLTPPAHAQTSAVWKAAASGMWTDATKWNPAVVPNNGDGMGDANTYNVTIAAAGAAYVVTVAAAETVTNFTLNSSAATLTIAGGSLSTLGTDSIQAGAVVLGSGTSSTGTFNVGGSKTLTIAAGATLSGNGTVASNGGINAISNAGTISTAAGQTLKVSSESITNTGTIRADGASATLTAQANAYFDTSINHQVNGTFSNASGGLLTATNGGTLNLGTFSSNTSSTNFSNAGSIVANAGTVNLGGNETTAQLGSVTISNGGVVKVSGALNNAGATLGTSTVSGGALTLSGGTVTGGTLAAGGLSFSSAGGTLSGVSSTGGLTVSGAGANLFYSGGSIAGGLTVLGNNAYATLSNAATLAGNISLAGPTSGQSAALVLNENDTLVSGQTATLGAAQSGGTGSLYVENGHTLTIASGATVTGGGQVSGFYFTDAVGGNVISNAGTISSTAGQNLGVRSQTIQNAGTIRADGANSSVNLLAGSSPTNGALTNSAGGLLTATNGGTLSIGANLTTNFTNFGSVAANGGTVNLSGSLTTAQLGSVTVSNGGVFNFSGQLNNAGATLTTTGGPLTLSGGTITGGAVSAGSLAFAGTPSSGTLSGVSLSGGLSLVGDYAGATLTGGTTVAGNIVVAGSSSDSYAQLLVNQNLAIGQAVTLGSGAGNFGYLNVQGGHTLTVAASGIITGNGFIQSSLDINSPGNAGVNSLNNAGFISTSYSTSAQSLVISFESITNSGSIVVGPQGTLSVFANQSGNGTVNGTIINQANGYLQAQGGGVLNVGNGGANFTNNGTINIFGRSSVDVYAGTSGAFTNFNPTTHTLTGGTYYVAGVFQFDGANIITNAATINLVGASAQILNSTTNGDALANIAVNAVGGNFFLQGHSLSTPGGLSNAGAVDLNSSTLTVGSGNYTQTGGTTSFSDYSGRSVLALSAAGGLVDIQGGSFLGNGIVNGNFRNASINNFAYYGTGVMTINGNFTQLSAGTLNITINGPAAGTGYEVLSVGGAAALGGTLTIGAFGNFTPFNGEVFQVITYASHTGTFATINGLDLGNGFTLVPVYNATNISLIAVPEPVASLSFAIGLGSAGFYLIRRRRAEGV